MRFPHVLSRQMRGTKFARNLRRRRHNTQPARPPADIHQRSRRTSRGSMANAKQTPENDVQRCKGAIDEFAATHGYRTALIVVQASQCTVRSAHAMHGRLINSSVRTPSPRQTRETCDRCKQRHERTACHCRARGEEGGRGEGEARPRSTRGDEPARCQTKGIRREQ